MKREKTIESAKKRARERHKVRKSTKKNAEKGAFFREKYALKRQRVMKMALFLRSTPSSHILNKIGMEGTSVHHQDKCL